MAIQQGEQLQRIGGRPAWQIGHTSKNDLVNLSQFIHEGTPTRVFAATIDPTVIRMTGNDDVTTALDILAKVAQKLSSLRKVGV